MLRCFVGVELNDEARQVIAGAQRALSAFDRVVRWTPVGNVHLTLKFLGEVRDSDVERVCEAAKRAAGGSGPIPFGIRGLGCFPPKGRARIIWIGVEPHDAGLIRCQRIVEEEMARLGFRPEDRVYSPHLTIGRVRSSPDTKGLPEALEKQEVAGSAQDPGELVLFESNLTPRGAVYAAVARCPLGTS